MIQDQGAAGASSPVTKANPMAVGVDADSVALLRRIVKLLETLGTVDSSQRLRVTVDAYNLSNISGSQSLNSVSSVGNIQLVGGATADPRYNWTDAARAAYNDGIRSHLTFS